MPKYRVEVVFESRIPMTIEAVDLESAQELAEAEADKLDLSDITDKMQRTDIEIDDQIDYPEEDEAFVNTCTKCGGARVNCKCTVCGAE